MLCHVDVVSDIYYRVRYGRTWRMGSSAGCARAVTLVGAKRWLRFAALHMAEVLRRLSRFRNSCSSFKQWNKISSFSYHRAIGMKFCTRQRLPQCQFININNNEVQ
eukprot:g21846.t1